MADITGATATFVLAIASLFPAPIQLQGFAADDVFTTDPQESAEVLMGVDGFLSTGFVFVPVRQMIALQADSPSNDLFDFWHASMVAAKQAFFAQGNVNLPAINRNWTLINGTLTTYPPVPDGKRLLQPRRFGITWESISPAVAL